MSRYIDADKLIDDINREIGEYLGKNVAVLVRDVINEQPTADVVEIVRCKDCKHRDENCRIDSDTYCDITRGYMADDDWCSYGKRRGK